MSKTVSFNFSRKLLSYTSKLSNIWSFNKPLKIFILTSSPFSFIGNEKSFNILSNSSWNSDLAFSSASSAAAAFARTASRASSLAASLPASFSAFTCSAALAAAAFFSAFTLSLAISAGEGINFLSWHSLINSAEVPG